MLQGRDAPSLADGRANFLVSRGSLDKLGFVLSGGAEKDTETPTLSSLLPQYGSSSSGGGGGGGGGGAGVRAPAFGGRKGGVDPSISASFESSTNECVEEAGGDSGASARIPYHEVADWISGHLGLNEAQYPLSSLPQEGTPGAHSYSHSHSHSSTHHGGALSPGRPSSPSSAAVARSPTSSLSGHASTSSFGEGFDSYLHPVPYRNSG